MGQVSIVASAFSLPIIEKNISVNKMEVNEELKKIKHNLEHLTLEQKEIVSKLLQVESEVFSKQKNDIGCVKDFKLDINLTDEFPVAETYRKIPGHLHKEVKNHIKDLLANGWIRHLLAIF